MNDDINRFFRASVRLAVSAALLVALSAPGAIAQPKDAAAPPARLDAPDGAPQLAKETTIGNTSTAVGRPTEGATSVVIVDEERVQGRLATATVSVAGGKGYTVVDPAAGRVDRPAGNTGKRVSPSLWELLRF